MAHVGVMNEESPAHKDDERDTSEGRRRGGGTGD